MKSKIILELRLLRRNEILESIIMCVINGTPR